MLLLGFTKRSIPKRDQHRKDIIQKELLFYRKYPHKNVMLLACLNHEMQGMAPGCSF